MPIKKSKKKVTVLRPTARAASSVDPLRHKLHDLANSLEAISMARQFVPRSPASARSLDAIESALGDARKALHQIDADLRKHQSARPQTAGR